MNRILKVGDKVYGACTNFNSGETWLEEHVVKEISDENILTTHIADHRKRKGALVREECWTTTDHEGGIDDINYFSMPVDEMLTKHIEENRWLAEQFIRACEEQ